MEQFPQTYLGLPLSDTKLNLTAFSPLIARVDRHLAAWQNQFLNARGRSVLINLVIDGAGAYLMAANQFPQGVFDVLDSRRRAFLWDSTPSTIGAHCLVAWTKVCDSKEAGGMGIRDLQLQNQCLLLKLVHRLHHPEDSAWAHWARRGLHLGSLTGPYAVGNSELTGTR